MGQCPVERQWSQDTVIPEGAGRSSVCGTGQQAVIVKNRLKRIQYWPGLINGSSPRPDSPANLNRHAHQTPAFSLCRTPHRGDGGSFVPTGGLPEFVPWIPAGNGRNEGMAFTG